MIYDDGIAMDENGRAKACPVCGNEQFSEDADFVVYAALLFTIFVKAFKPMMILETMKALNSIKMLEMQGSARNVVSRLTF